MKNSAILSCTFTVIYLIFILITSANCQRRRRQFDPAPDLPSHLPAPPKPSAPAPPPSNASGAGTGQIGGFLEGQPPLPPPQNGPLGLAPGQLVPFGLNHIILIIVPTFKTQFRKNQEWFTSKVKVSMPITVFFDQLKVPPELLAKGIAGFPLPPLGIPPPVPPPGGLGPIPPPAHTSFVPPSPGGAPLPNAQMNAGYGYHHYPRKPYIYGGGHEADADELDDEGYDIDFYSESTEEDRKRRRKRDLFTTQLFHMESSYNPHFYNHSNFRPKRSTNFNDTLHLTDRASLFPRLENILESTDFGGKPCLLRAVCEVHEGPLNHYGLLGELITMFFSVSKSMFAESHLPDYLRAEALGRSGNCTEFFRDCETTYFSWEEKIMHTNDI